MGLLSEPESAASRLRPLMRLHRPFCFTLVFVSIVWFALLAYEPFNNVNYFSENALLPGLVQSEFVDDGSIRKYLDEFQTEIEENYKTKDSIPLPWIAAKMRQINLDVYTHNFTLNYPLGKGRVFHGENVYGILRAGRSASTEALVLSSPYRPPSSQHHSTNAGIALILAFAKFARSQKYWAKDIIFLITEHEQLGAQAWLEAYHGIGTHDTSDITLGPFYKYDSHSKNNKKILDSGNLKGRAGAIQAAINLELPALQIKYINVKVEGLNGQLPNLDLVNLVHKMCIKSNVHHAYKNSFSWTGNFKPWKKWLNNLSTMLLMVTTQLTGVPTGNHGLFHRYGIEAVTLEGIEVEPLLRGKSTRHSRPPYALEGILRSLNNLLERFHQSYFFYLRPATDRFVSIGQYMPPLGILIGALFIRAFAIWLAMQNNKKEIPKIENEKNQELDEQYKTAQIISHDNVNFSLISIIYLITHVIGYIIMCSPQLISEIGVEYFDLTTETAIFYGFIILSIFSIFIYPIVCNLVYKNKITCDDISMLNIIVLLELGILVLSVGMHNFSLGFCLAVVYTPFTLLIDVPHDEKKTKNGKRLSLIKGVWFLLHPLVLSMLIICCYTAFIFPEEAFKSWIDRGLKATQHAVMFSIVDSLIYGNWLFNVVTMTLLPTWMLIWQQLCHRLFV